MGLLSKIWGIVTAVFTDAFTAVSASFNVILSELPNDEIAILNGAMKEGAAALNANPSSATGLEDAITAALNYVAAQEGQELSKVGNQLLMAFLHSLPNAPAAAAPAPAGS